MIQASAGFASADFTSGINLEMNPLSSFSKYSRKSDESTWLHCSDVRPVEDELFSLLYFKKYVFADKRSKALIFFKQSTSSTGVISPCTKKDFTLSRRYLPRSLEIGYKRIRLT